MWEGVYPRGEDGEARSDDHFYTVQKFERSLLPDLSLLLVDGVGFRGWHCDEEPSPSPVVATLLRGTKLWLLGKTSVRVCKSLISEEWKLRQVVSHLLNHKSQYSFLIQKVGQTVILPTLQPHAVLTVSGLYPEDLVKGATLLSSYVTFVSNPEAIQRRMDWMVGSGRRQGSAGRGSRRRSRGGLTKRKVNRR